MTRDKMKEVQGGSKNPKKFFQLNHKAVVQQATDTLVKLAAFGHDPMKVWHKCLAPMTIGERKEARSDAVRIWKEIQEKRAKMTPTGRVPTGDECTTCGNDHLDPRNIGELSASLDEAGQKVVT